MKINILNESNDRFMLLSKLFAYYPDISSEDEDYLNSLNMDELVSEIRNRGWDNVLEESLNEYWDKVEDTPYYKVASKSVMDSDGFWTEYTMYYNEDEDNYFFIFGDSDIYGPDPAYADWECETNDEAVEWYNNYNGFEDEEEDDFDDFGSFEIEEDDDEVDESFNNPDFESKPGSEVTFETAGMTKIPNEGDHFRVGPLTGTCIERTDDSVKMRVEGNSFLQEKLTISEDLFDDIELPDASPNPEVTVESEPSKETPEEGPEFGVATLLNNLICANWDISSTYNDLVVNAEANNMLEIAQIAQDIAAEINTHIGKLQAALKTISRNVENISVGEEEAAQELENTSIEGE